MGHYRLHVQLNEDDPQDRIVIAALERLGERGKSRWVRQVLFEAVTEPARSEILAGIRAVLEAVRRLEMNGVVIAGAAGGEGGEEPEEAARNLDGLLDRLAGWE